MNRIITIFKKRKYLYIAVLLSIVGGYYWYNKAHTTTGTVQYKTTLAEKGTLTTSISGSGNVIVDQSSNIDPTITGTVSNLVVSVGDKVTKGQVLFTVDNDALSLAVTKAYSSYLSSLSSLESAKASKKEAKENLDDNTGGAQGKIILEKKLEIAEANIATAQENVTYALQNLKNERSNYAKRNVISPINGTVNAINIKNGDDLSKLASGSSRTVPIIIGDLDTMKAQVQINEVDVSSVTIDQKATLIFSAIEDLQASGKVEKMDSLGTLASGVVTYNVTIGFDTLDRRVKPGMSVSANIITDVKQDAIIVPNSAIKTQNGISHVEILSGQTPEQKTVTLGASNNTYTQIISGINVGDRVITQTINSSNTTSSASSQNSSASNRNSGGLRVPGLGGGRPD